ncbi:ABC transporter substrate-binding protein [Streptomyces sp. JJ66]|uniref:ABC transporter substrate-binding protein n=1 Tax=Streptomyces sp. JJ66 TaxID=2803843 RepID=UPI001C5596AE|nr:ABC transporter substrate-binding protein [Streptomyces sp. JJ66]MBW1604251.1 ABC transporter substrate-binding protein [Streptomyces sp. JJ66]
MRHPRRTFRPRGTALAATAALAAALTACGGGGESLEEQGGQPTGEGGGDQGSLVIGAAGFTESTVLAQLYAQVLEDAGYNTSVQQLTTRELYEPALESGDLDVVPEYAATLAEFLNAKVNGPQAAAESPVASNDVRETVAALRELAEPRGLTVLEPGDAVNQNAFAVTEEFAEEHGLKTLSDVGEAGLEIRLAAGDECPDRPFCQPGLEQTYGIDVAALDPKGVGSVQAKQSVADGENDMVLTTTTDATLDQFGLVLLEDDKNLQNADNVLPVLNTQDAGDDTVAATLNKLTAQLTTKDLTELNRQVDAERRKASEVAREYLESRDLVG